MEKDKIAGDIHLPPGRDCTKINTILPIDFYSIYDIINISNEREEIKQ